MDKTIEGTLAKFIEFRIFELFRNRLIGIIKPHCRQDSKEDIYQHLFLCPSQVSKKRNFQLHGVLSPFVCLWRTSLLEWDTDYGLYGRSVLPRDFVYEKKDGVGHERGFLYDVKLTFEVFSSSYYKDFRDRVNQDLLDMDRLRYFDIDVKELFSDCIRSESRAEVKLTGVKSSDNVDDKNNRSFDLSAQYEVRITIPYCMKFDYLEQIRVYVNDNLIYTKDAITLEEDNGNK